MFAVMRAKRRRGDRDERRVAVRFAVVAERGEVIGVLGDLAAADDRGFIAELEDAVAGPIARIAERRRARETARGVVRDGAVVLTRQQERLRAAVGAGEHLEGNAARLVMIVE